MCLHLVLLGEGVTRLVYVRSCSVPVSFSLSPVPSPLYLQWSSRLSSFLSPLFLLLPTPISEWGVVLRGPALSGARWEAGGFLGFLSQYQEQPSSHLPPKLPLLLVPTLASRIRWVWKGEWGPPFTGWTVGRSSHLETGVSQALRPNTGFVP